MSPERIRGCSFEGQIESSVLFMISNLNSVLPGEVADRCLFVEKESRVQGGSQAAPG